MPIGPSRILAYVQRVVGGMRLREPDGVPIIVTLPCLNPSMRLQEVGRIGLRSTRFPWQIEGKAKLVPGIHPNVVSTTHGWWFPEEGGPEHGCFRTNSNSIISNRPPYDPVNGNYQVRAVLCRAEAL